MTAPFRDRLHCLRDPSRRPDRSDLPSIAQILVAQLHIPALAADAVDRTLQESDKTTLY